MFFVRSIQHSTQISRKYPFISAWKFGISINLFYPSIYYNSFIGFVYANIAYPYFVSFFIGIDPGMMRFHGWVSAIKKHLFFSISRCSLYFCTFLLFRHPKTAFSPCFFSIFQHSILSHLFWIIILNVPLTKCVNNGKIIPKDLFAFFLWSRVFWTRSFRIGNTVQWQTAKL